MGKQQLQDEVKKSTGRVQVSSVLRMAAIPHLHLPHVARPRVRESISIVRRPGMKSRHPT